MTRQFPDPGDRFNLIEINDPRVPSGTVQVEVPEIERRQSHINLIDPAHPLFPVALECINNRDRVRPSSHELCGRMSTLKASPKYSESVQQSQVNTKPTKSANTESREREIQQSQQIRDFQQQLHTQSDQLQGKEQENQQQLQQILGLQTLLSTKDEQLQALQQQLAGKNQQLQRKEAAISAHQQQIQQLRQQLQSSEQVAAEFQQKLLEREKMTQDQQQQNSKLQQQPQQGEGQRQEEVEASGAEASADGIKLRWRDGGRAPCAGMYGAVAAVDGSVAYFRCGVTKQENYVYSYDSSSRKWSELSECPNYGFSLAVVNSLLTAIGGRTPRGEVTNLLLSLTESKWTKQFLPMPTKRWLTAVVCSGRSLVVAGGSIGHKRLNTVEVMDTETLQWSTASSLPHPLSEASATLCGDQVYMLGGFDQNAKDSKSVFTCSLAALLQPYQPQSLVTRLKTSLASGPKVWHQLADTPVTLSTCASLHGQLLSVGGRNSDGMERSAIYMYNATTNSWKVIGHMAAPRRQCLVAVLPHNELMVAGGYTADSDWPGTDSVEIATIV